MSQDPPQDSTISMSQVSDPHTGRVIADRLRLGMCVGAGGMARVYLAEQLDVGRSVVVKLLRPTGLDTLSDHRGLIARFHREARAVARLNHPNIVQVHFFGETEEGEPYLVLEYISGRPLDVVLDQEGPLDVERSLRILDQIAAAMEAAHAAGVVHRDLKPGNVMLQDGPAEAPRIKVLDFGIAKMVEDADDHTGMKQTSPLTMSGEVYGTPEYVSPEQARGEVVDHRSDLYALGCLAYELLTGLLVFEVTGRRHGHLIKHATELPVAPSRRGTGKHIPPSVDALIMRCLEKDPEARPPSASALRTQIARILDHLEPPRAATPAEALLPAPSAPTERRRSSWLLPAAVVALGGLVGGLLALGKGEPDIEAAPQPEGVAAVAPRGTLAPPLTPTRGDRWAPARHEGLAVDAGVDLDASSALKDAGEVASTDEHRLERQPGGHASKTKARLHPPDAELADEEQAEEPPDATPDSGALEDAADLGPEPDARVKTRITLILGVPVPTGTEIVQQSGSTAEVIVPMGFHRAYHHYRSRYYHPNRYALTGSPAGRDPGLTVIATYPSAPFGTFHLKPLTDAQGNPDFERTHLIIDRHKSAIYRHRR